MILNNPQPKCENGSQKVDTDVTISKLEVVLVVVGSVVLVVGSVVLAVDGSSVLVVVGSPVLVVVVGSAASSRFVMVESTGTVGFMSLRSSVYPHSTSYE